VSEFDTDLFVIGGGSGGVRAARISAGYGARVMVAEESRMGGTCVIRGCVPKKLYVYASRFADTFEDCAGFGWSGAEGTFDFATLKANKDTEINRLEQAYRGTLERAGVSIVDSRATIVDANTVRLERDGATVRARHILVATGGRPHLPQATPGIHLAESSDDLFEWDALPKSIVIVGVGYIGVEFACMLARLGSKVTLITRRDKVLPKFDEDLRATLHASMEGSGIRIITQTDVEAIDGRPGNLSVTLLNGEAVAAERVLYATGRKPNTKGLGLENAGVLTGANGEIVVDHWSATNIPSIHAVGDVTDRIALTPVAIREGHAFADTVFGNKPTPVDIGPVPTAVFSTPELGTIGLTEAEARATHEEIVIFKTSFRAMKATLSGSAERVLMKLVVDGKSDRVLGVHILGEGAGEMIQCLGIAIRMGATKRDFDSTLAVHPTAAEELVTMRTPFTPVAM
jgi:glutathione reductase (NADPH)